MKRCGIPPEEIGGSVGPALRRTASSPWPAHAIRPFAGTSIAPLSRGHIDGVILEQRWLAGWSTVTVQTGERVWRRQEPRSKHRDTAPPRVVFPTGLAAHGRNADEGQDRALGPRPGLTRRGLEAHEARELADACTRG